jgi:hypothetical protein
MEKNCKRINMIIVSLKTKNEKSRTQSAYTKTSLFTDRDANPEYSGVLHTWGRRPKARKPEVEMLIFYALRGDDICNC